jgi:hypothetical protein
MWSPFKASSQLKSPISSSIKDNKDINITEVYIKTNDKLKHLIYTVLIHYPILKGEERLQLEEQYESELISYSTLNILSQYLKSKYEYSVYVGNKKVHDKLTNYLTGSILVFPNLMKKDIEVDPELIKRRQYLLARQEAREYNKMMYGTYSDPNVQKALSQGNHMESVKEQLSVSANMIVSVFAMFGISYYIGYQYSKNQTTCMIFGIVGATIIMIVEMGIYIIRAIKLEAVYESTESRNEKKEALAQLRTGSLFTAHNTIVKDNNKGSKSKSIFHKAFKPADDEDSIDAYIHEGGNSHQFSQTIDDDDDDDIDDDESLALYNNNNINSNEFKETKKNK